MKIDSHFFFKGRAGKMWQLSLVFGSLFLVAACVSTASLVSFNTNHLTVLVGKAHLIVDAPQSVQAAVAAANRIAGKPYKYGGGHGQFEDEGYDCSGTTSYVLHAAGVLEEAMPSSSFQTWGEPGPGKWITVFARSGHVFLVVAGARFDTTDHANIGPGWREDERLDKSFAVRHPAGL